MLILSEDDIRALASPEDAFTAVADVYRSLAMEKAVNYPVVREPCGKAVFGVKSGFDASISTLGLKAGGYWPGNTERGLTNHQSAAILFDAETGRANALLSGNFITALRTAAACAVSIDCLSRQDVETLGVIGAGAQVPHHVRAALKVRPFKRVIVWNRTHDKARETAAVLKDEDCTVEVVSDVDALGQAADVIITLTAATSPVLEPRSVQPGTHIAAMGSDTAGKQELSADLVSTARLFVDDFQQSKTIGERQFLAQDNARSDPAIAHIGDVLLGRTPARLTETDITVFDSTGVALQDIALARLVIARAKAQGIGVEVSF